MSLVSKSRQHMATLLVRAALENIVEQVRSEAKQVFAESCPFEQISRFLPFQTKIVAGYNHNHIMSQTAFDIVTEKRVIREGETLCGRQSHEYFLEAIDSNCPGCLAIGQGLALREILPLEEL